MSKSSSSHGSLTSVYQDTVMMPFARPAAPPPPPPLFTAEAGPPPVGFSGRDFLQLLFKYKWTVLLTIVIVSALSIFGALVQPTYYTASAQVIVKTDQQAAATSLLASVAMPKDQFAIDPPNRRIETEMSALLNESNVEAVVQKYGLTTDVLKRSPLQVMQAWLKPYVKELKERFPELAGASKPARPADDLGDTVNAFLKSASAEPVRSKTSDVTSNVIEVSLTGTDPTKVQQALTGLVQLYVSRSSARDLQLIKLAVAALSEQTAEAQTKLAQADDAVIRYSLRPGMAPLAATQAARQAESINAKLRADIESLQTKLDMLRQTYGEQYTEVRTTRAALEQLRSRQMEQSQDNTRSDATISILERRRALAEARYSELQRKLDQVNLFMALGPAQVESRISLELPRRAEKAPDLPVKALMVVGPLVGILLAIALATAFDMFDRRLQSRHAVARYLGLETLGSVPVMPRQRARIFAAPAPSYFVPLAGEGPKPSPEPGAVPDASHSRQAVKQDDAEDAVEVTYISAKKSRQA